MARPLAVDLFAGVGGLSLGLEQAGFDVVCAAEIDSKHAQVHRVNFPYCEVLEADIAKLSIKELYDGIYRGLVRHGRSGEYGKRVDLLAGGPPCQGFSVGGRGDRADPRNSLVQVFAKCVARLRPKYFIMENVPGLLLPRHEATLNKLIKTIAASGYTIVGPLTVNSASVGVPQFRQRVLILGACEDVEPINDKLLIQLANRKNWASRHSYTGEMTPVTVADAIDDLRQLIKRRDSSNTIKLPKGYDDRLKSQYVRMLRMPANGYAYPRVWDRSLLQGVSLTLHSPEATLRFRNTPAGAAERISRYPRLKADGLANTLRAGTGVDHGSHTPPRPIHYTEPRVITVREAARLHSFPDWFQFHETKWHAWRQIGNSVPPQLGRTIGEIVISALRIKPSKPQKKVLILSD